MFWEKKSLFEMTYNEWESLCDGCGICCLEKFQDPKSGKVYFTDLACPFMDLHSCRCMIYENRNDFFPDCIQLTPENVKKFRWLPKTCSYRLLSKGKQLPQWHPLLTGESKSVHRQGISIKKFAISSIGIPENKMQSHIITIADLNRWCKKQLS
jgi:uncharacterized cysteine cluster protein YcgN (CxxCxxCC family)